MKIVSVFAYSVLTGILLSAGPKPAFADTATPLQWQVPYFGTINLNLTTTEALIGYDGVLKQAIGGASLPIYTDPAGLVTLQVGADAPWQTNGATIEPLVMAGHDILKEIPGLNQFTSAHLNVFGRWASESGKAGAGIAFSYSFGGGTIEPSSPVVSPPAAPVAP